MKNIDLSKEQLERNALLKMVSDKVNDLIGGGRRIKVLEAGCGSASYITFRHEIIPVGIDISKEQLERNMFIKEKILGDLQTYPLPPEEYDVIVCWDVLEHLQKPMVALKNLFRSLKKGRGIIILAFPNLISFKGLVTKGTPYWYHKLFYRLMGYQKQPFPTYFRLSIRPNQVKRFAISQGLSIEFSHLFESLVQKRVRNRYFVADLLFRLADFLTRGLTFGRVNFLNSQCILIFRK